MTNESDPAGSGPDTVETIRARLAALERLPVEERATEYATMLDELGRSLQELPRG